jgi:hypothetical protein
MKDHDPMSRPILKLRDNFMETSIDDEIVVMELDKGTFFSLTGTSLSIWGALDDELDHDALLARLAGEFGVVADDIAQDVDDFLGQLRDAGLITGG